MPGKRRPPKLKVGDVIRFDEDNFHLLDLHERFKGAAWIVMQIDPEENYADCCIRIRPTSGGIAMTSWLWLYDDEYTIDVFLSAAYKASRKK